MGNRKETVTFYTYPPMFKNYKTFQENENYDRELRSFTVPKKWASEWIFKTYKMWFDEFLNEYTWDDTYDMYESALDAGVASNIKIVERYY